MKKEPQHIKRAWRPIDPDISHRPTGGGGESPKKVKVGGGPLAKPPRTPKSKPEGKQES